MQWVSCSVRRPTGLQDSKWAGREDNVLKLRMHGWTAEHGGTLHLRVGTVLGNLKTAQTLTFRRWMFLGISFLSSRGEP